MRAVFDTNVLLSGLIWRGAPHHLLAHVRTGDMTLVTSPALLAELAGVVRRPKFADKLTRLGVSAGRVLAEIGRLAEIVDPPPLLSRISRDADDDAVLALAAAARADLIVSGDADLLVLLSHAGVPIVTPAQALALIGSSS